MSGMVGVVWAAVAAIGGVMPVESARKYCRCGVDIRGHGRNNVSMTTTHTDRTYDNSSRDATACNWCCYLLPADEIEDNGLCADCQDQPPDRAELGGTWAELDGHLTGD